MPNPENIEPYQFKKGQSGNPDGRPKGTPNYSTVIRKIMDGEITDAKGDRKTRRYITVAALVRKAMKGNIKAFKELADREEGKALQRQHIDQKIDSNINVIWELDGKKTEVTPESDESLD